MSVFKKEDSIRVEKIVVGKKRKRTSTYYFFKCKKEGCNNEIKQVSSQIYKLKGYCKKCSDLKKLDKARNILKETTCKFKNKFCKISYSNCKQCKKLMILKQNRTPIKKYCSRKCSQKFNNNNYPKTDKGRYNYAKKEAKSKHKGKSKYDFKLTQKEYLEILGDRTCFYCKGIVGDKGIGLDRIDSSKCYFKENVVPCCTKCNILKCELLTQTELIEVIKLLKNLRKGKIW